MSHHAARPTPARRIFSQYSAPRKGAWDSDYGAYTGNPNDPRYDGPVMCCDCMGTKYGPDGAKCEFCAGQGVIWEDEQ